VGRRGEEKIFSLEKFSPPLGKMCWAYIKTIGQRLKNLGLSQKAIRHPWCPKLVTGLSFTDFKALR